MDPKELKRLHDEQTKIVNDLRAIIESEKADSAEAKEKVVKMEARLDEIETINQKVTKEADERRVKLDELKDQYDVLQKQALRVSAGDVKEKSAHMKSFEKFIVEGKDALNAEELKYLRTNNNASGGFLAPRDYLQEIQKNLVEISAMRQLARIRTTSRTALEIPRRSAEPTGYWVGQAGSTTESESTYALELIPVHKLSVYSIATREMLNDAAFDMESEITFDAVQDMAQTEGAAFINGTGVNQPEGILVNATLVAGARNSGIADDFTADNLIDLSGDIKVGYNPSYIMKRQTTAAIRKLKDGAGHYVWQSGLAAGLPNSINGYPYKIMQDMDTIGASAYPVAFGDFNKGYNIVDGVSLYIIRDEFTLSTSGKIKFVYLKFVGGKVILTEAIKLLKCSA